MPMSSVDSDSSHSWRSNHLLTTNGSAIVSSTAPSPVECINSAAWVADQHGVISPIKCVLF